MRTAIIRDWGPKCPCGSGKDAAACCWKDGALFKAPVRLAQADGFRNPKCYANFLGGCSTKITNEHLWSQHFGFKPSGFPIRTPAGRNLPHPAPRAETVKILCDVHNSRFNDFDSAGKVLKTAIEAAYNGEDRFFLISGHDLERFILQRLCAWHIGGLTSTDGASTREREFKEGSIEAAFQLDPVPQGSGLYMLPERPDWVSMIPIGIELTPLWAGDDQANVFAAGCRFTLGPLAFAYFVEEPVPELYPIRLGMHRPHQIIMHNVELGSFVVIELAWMEEFLHSEGTVQITLHSEAAQP